jgi:multidrug efflux pump subunit AcrA (membrane-fusion protein)
VQNQSQESSTTNGKPKFAVKFVVEFPLFSVVFWDGFLRKRHDIEATMNVTPWRNFFPLKIRLLLGGIWLLGALSCTRQERSGNSDMAQSFLAEIGLIRMEIPFQGEMEARRVAMVSVGIQGSAVLTELAEEGRHVEKGDIVARLDSSQIEADLVRFEHDCERARQELESLEKAEIPLDILDMQAQLLAAENEWQAEERFLEAATGLMVRGLMAEGEIEQQTGKVAGLKAKVEQTRQRMELTQKHVHVARLAKAKAALAAAIFSSASAS